MLQLMGYASVVCLNKSDMPVIGRLKTNAEQEPASVNRNSLFGDNETLGVSVKSMKSFFEGNVQKTTKVKKINVKFPPDFPPNKTTNEKDVAKTEQTKGKFYDEVDKGNKLNFVTKTEQTKEKLYDEVNKGINKEGNKLDIIRKTEETIEKSYDKVDKVVNTGNKVNVITKTEQTKEKMFYEVDKVTNTVYKLNCKAKTQQNLEKLNDKVDKVVNTGNKLNVLTKTEQTKENMYDEIDKDLALLNNETPAKNENTIAKENENLISESKKNEFVQISKDSSIEKTPEIVEVETRKDEKLKVIFGETKQIHDCNTSDSTEEITDDDNTSTYVHYDENTNDSIEDIDTENDEFNEHSNDSSEESEEENIYTNVNYSKKTRKEIDVEKEEMDNEYVENVLESKNKRTEFTENAEEIDNETMEEILQRKNDLSEKCTNMNIEQINATQMEKLVAIESDLEKVKLRCEKCYYIEDYYILSDKLSELYKQVDRILARGVHVKSQKKFILRNIREVEEELDRAFEHLK